MKRGRRDEGRGQLTPLTARRLWVQLWMHLRLTGESAVIASGCECDRPASCPGCFPQQLNGRMDGQINRQTDVDHAGFSTLGTLKYSCQARKHQDKNLRRESSHDRSPIRLNRSRLRVSADVIYLTAVTAKRRKRTLWLVNIDRSQRGAAPHRSS